MIVFIALTGMTHSCSTKPAHAPPKNALNSTHKSQQNDPNQFSIQPAHSRRTQTEKGQPPPSVIPNRSSLDLPSVIPNRYSLVGIEISHKQPMTITRSQ
ncbi:hypothetical protein AKJ16_DCAP10134 [Drosera capensis]